MKRIILVSLFLVLGSYAMAGDGPANSNVLSAGPDENIPLHEGTKVGFTYQVPYRKVGFLSIEWGYEVRINWQGLVKDVFSDSANICNEEKCAVYDKNRIYVRDENADITTSDGRTFKVSDKVLVPERNRVGEIVAFSMTPTQIKKQSDRVVFVRFDDDSAGKFYLSAVEKAR